MAKGTYRRKARKPAQRRGGGSKLNTCLKRAQRSTIRPMLPGETAAEMRSRLRKEQKLMLR